MSKKFTKCPICKNIKFKKYFNSSISLTSDRNLVRKKSDVGYCYKCRIIINSTGCRNKKKKFYYEEYNLFGGKAEEEFRIYSEKNSGSESEIMAKFFFNNSSLKKNGRLLEIGAGKGLFLKHLKTLLPQMEYFALEPSYNASKYFRKNLPDVKFDQNALENSKFNKLKFDVIVSTGVIEHVHSPDQFLKSINTMLTPGGIVYLCMPNFESKVDDLILYDHLSKLTKYSLNFLFNKYKFKILEQNISSKRVWIWNILKKESYKKNSKSNHKDLIILNKNISNFKKMEINFIKYAKNKKNLNFYGLGNSGFYFYFKYLKKFKNKIKFIILDNSSFLNSFFFGAKVISRNEINKYNIEDIYISANPCYHSLMKKKLKKGRFKGEIFN